MSATTHGRILASEFRPAAGLAGAHVQTLLGGAPFARRPRARRERWELPDGDFLDLDWVAPRGTSWALVLPGLTGHLGSAYAVRLLRSLSARGFRAGLLNYRGHSGIPNRLATGYHAGFTRDLDLLVSCLARSGGPGVLAGYSMGGNLLLKWLGERGADAPVAAAAAVSVPFELAPAAESLRHGAGRGYDRYLLPGLRRYVRRKAPQIAGSIPLPPLRRLRSIRDFDEHITAPLHGFAGAADYYARSSCRPWLGRIGVPTLIVNAIDDPLVPAATLPAANELAGTVTLELAERGGHVGFVGRGPLGLPRFLLEERLAGWLQDRSREAAAKPSAPAAAV